MSDEDDLAWRLAKKAGKGALKDAFGGGEDDDTPPKPSWKKKLLAGGAGLLAAFYVFNKFIPILLPLAFADLLLAGGIVAWAMHVWGVRPLQLLRKKKPKELEDGSGST